MQTEICSRAPVARRAEKMFKVRRPRGRGYKRSYTSSFRVVTKLCSKFVPVIIDNTAPVAQLDRATASGAVGCAFEPRRAHIIWRFRNEPIND